MEISQKLLDEFKVMMKKEGREYKSDAEARIEAQRFTDLVELLYEAAKKKMGRDKKLKEYPKGFPIDEEGYFTCLLCHGTISKENGWYDKHGFKCLDCQRAVDKKQIPAKVLKDSDSWLADWQIQYDFGVHPATRGKLKREGFLKGIDLKREDGSIYFTLYLLKDNQEFLKKYPRKPQMKMTVIDSTGKQIEL